MQLSLKQIFLLCLYVALCSLVYMSTNLWFGTLVVVATSAWMALAMIHAFRKRNHFSLGSALFGWIWLTFWPGFYAELPPTTKLPDLASLFIAVVAPIYEVTDIDSTGPRKDYAFIYSIQYTGTMITIGDMTFDPPSRWNSTRLSVCLTGLVAGLSGGLCCHLMFGRGAKPRPMEAHLSEPSG